MNLTQLIEILYYIIYIYIKNDVQTLRTILMHVKEYRWRFNKLSMNKYGGN